MLNPLPEHLFETLFNHLSEPRIVVKADPPYFTIVACNEQYRLVSNTLGKDITGKSIKELHNSDPANIEGDLIIQDALNRAIATRKPVELAAVRYDIPGADGFKNEQSWWQAEYIPIPGKDGKVEYLMCTTYNITDQINNREAIDRAQQQLRLAVESAKMGTWDVNPTDYKLSLSDRSKELIGLPLIEEISIEEILKSIDPAYHQPVREAITNGVEHHRSCDLDYLTTNLITKEQKWIRITGKMFFDDSGKPAHYSGLMMDITERKLDDLRKNDFIAIVSHELKTPLTTLKAYVQMLIARATKTEDAFTTVGLEKVNQQVKKMTAMINGFLNIARLEAGKIHLDKKIFDLEKLIQETANEIGLITSGYNIDFVPCGSLMVHADLEKIAQVINNLLSNAIKYSLKGKTIIINCIIADGFAQVSIKDEGIGVNPHDLEKLFERYYRVENQFTRTISGFGIGLYFCAEIIKRHEGRIWAESEIGKGSTFYFTLPLLPIL